MAAADSPVTILFTDIENSTVIYDRLGDLRARELMAVHDSIVREQIERYGGREVKSMGDGFMIVFSSARRALDCAISIQRAFDVNERQPLPLRIRVRMGLNVGETVRESDDFFGTAVITAARIGAKAEGGEILVSSTFKEVCASTGDLLFDEGREVELKGLSGRHRVYKVLWDDEGKTCTTCLRKIPAASLVCPHCTLELDQTAKPAKPSRTGVRNWLVKRGLVLTVAVVILLLGFASVIQVYKKHGLGTDPVDLSALLGPIRDQYRLPGMVAAVVQGDRITAIGSVGVRKIGTSEPTSASDQIHLGSCTKAMTAVLVARMIDDGQLEWTSTLGDVFPEFADRMSPGFRGATIKQLLDDSAGFPTDVDWRTLDRTGDPVISQREQAVEQAVGTPPQYAPGTKYEYSNLDYVVLGAVLEKKTGQSWEDLIRTRLFQPLGMSSAGFGPPGTKGLLDEPWGHLLVDGKIKPLQFDNPPVFGPAGRVHCNMTDWARFVALYLQPRSQTLLAQRTLETLITPTAGHDFAGGWNTISREWGGGNVLTMTGSNTMWVSVVWVAPRKNFAILVSTNMGGDDAWKACDNATTKIIQSDQFARLLQAVGAQ
jgi:CubicO group peptidase (beta-lactamase class C family)/class 3 adenylate cyclase